MKKTKILIPALGMMMLSTAAAVSGTMAWFTANRAVTVTTTNFAVESLDGNLTVAGYNLAGTNPTNADGTSTIALQNNVKLGDASFNYNTGDLWTDIPNDDGETQPNSYVKISDLTTLGSTYNSANEAKWQAGSTTAYYAVAFKLTFTYQFKADTKARSLFFDTIGSTSAMSRQDANSTEKNRTGKGFRIALIAGSEKFVWAPQRGTADKYYTNDSAETATENVSYTYVQSASGENALANYTLSGDSRDLFCSQDTNNKMAAYASDRPALATDHTGRADYLGQITNSSGTGTLDVICVAWYEGSDPEVRNASSMDQIQSDLKFYIRTVA